MKIKPVFKVRALFWTDYIFGQENQQLTKKNKNVVILIPKPKLMVLKKHYSECNLYTLINYLGQGVKTIPNGITFRQSMEYFKH